MADEVILVPKAEGTVDDFFEAFFKAFEGNTSIDCLWSGEACFEKDGEILRLEPLFDGGTLSVVELRDGPWEKKEYAKSSRDGQCWRRKIDGG
ncbi:hypothetical protein [Haloferula luteola]|uniref:hypothetical protein n=1 Tax=Haloferula luteola TaxID=595692 RepID=UPI001C8434D5|nr:hypothetical protein [Haloferula luteola]